LADALKQNQGSVQFFLHPRYAWLNTTSFQRQVNQEEAGRSAIVWLLRLHQKMFNKE
jgi:hypothetical protein